VPLALAARGSRLAAYWILDIGYCSGCWVLSALRSPLQHLPPPLPTCGSCVRVCYYTSLCKGLAPFRVPRGGAALPHGSALHTRPHALQAPSATHHALPVQRGARPTLSLCKLHSSRGECVAAPTAQPVLRCSSSFLERLPPPFVALLRAGQRPCGYWGRPPPWPQWRPAAVRARPLHGPDAHWLNARTYLP
jgi:hypothetical protein